jgi:LPXTG-site transpeptidase (sortase) family protein
MPLRRHRPGGVRRTIGGVLVIGVPALIAGIAVALLTDPGPAPQPELGSLVVRGKGPTANRDGTHGRRPPPSVLRIRAAGIRVPVQPVGTRGGELEVPPIDRVGWVRGGPRPGEPGRTVLIGHRDSQAGPAPFAGLTTLAPGDHVETIAGHSHDVYEVSGIQEIAKSDFPAARVYATTRRSSLALITCDGLFSEPTGYADNLIVYARQIAGPGSHEARGAGRRHT